MKLKTLVAASLLSAVFFSSSGFALTDVQVKLTKTLNQYLEKYRDDEHISAVAITVSPKRGEFIHAYAGTTEYNGNGNAIKADSLFQIGSITKSFTSAIILRLAAKGKLSLDDTVVKYLPQYSEWKNITIRQLLNMTSGIANYSDLPSWSKIEGQNIRYNFTEKQLVAFAEGKPLTPGYQYTNTGYILAGMIVSKITHRPFVSEMRDLIKSMGLEDTYYFPGDNPRTITDRMPSGYYYNVEVPLLNRLILSKADPECIHGKASTDLKCNDLSWAGAAGGIVASTEAVTRWARALFTADKVIPLKMMTELKSIVSYKTGKPIAQTSANDPNGFGLGVVQAYKSPLGTYWFYQGSTLGYRVLYVYFPKNIEDNSGDGLIITIALNSQPVSCLDHIGELVMQIYQEFEADNLMKA